MFIGVAGCATAQGVASFQYHRGEQPHEIQCYAVTDENSEHFGESASNNSKHFSENSECQ